MNPPTASGSSSWLTGYPLAPGGFDETFVEPGKLRPHWAGLIDSLTRLGVEELNTRWESARRLLRDHGVTYNVYADPRGLDRPWSLDLLPFLIPPGEWRRIESGLVQRARLLNAILQDVYGPQRLLREALIPPALIFANPGFLRPCHGQQPPGGIFLSLLATDLARSPDGQWWVLSDRSQAPSGLGYVLENRVVISRVLPEEIRDGQVHRLSPFFGAQREGLSALAPPGRPEPNVVLLTPGPYNETYFEHDYLARYLGVPLVEGGDLTVRDRRVFIKTLEGLQPVDVILRRVDDSFCDPLELRGDSFLGVAGLVDAVRSGQVTVANALGSGVVESPAWLPFLPFLCRRLLDEDLELPNVGTWWCGQPRELDYVLTHPGQLVVKRAFPPGARESVFLEALDDEARETLVREMQSAPHRFVGQEQIELSTAPVWTGDTLDARPVVLRTYVVASADGYTVLPGGLARVSTSPQNLVVSMQHGGGSKDTWVLADAPVTPTPLALPTVIGIRRAPAAAEIPSRVADNLYWTGRYAERLENQLRLFRAVWRRMFDESATDEVQALGALLELLVDLGHLPRAFAQRVPMRQVELELHALVYKEQRAGSLAGLAQRLRQLAVLARDRFSTDTWRILNRMHDDFRPGKGRIRPVQTLQVLDQVVLDLAAFSGMGMENMTRGHTWRFLDVGRRIERAQHMAELLIATDRSSNSALLEPVLEIADSVMTYRRRYFARAERLQVLHLLLVDETNPRSFGFQLAALLDHMNRMPVDASGEAPHRERMMLGELADELATVDLVRLAETPADGSHPLQPFVGNLRDALGRISDLLTHHYFSHSLSRASRH